jgi:hypothetical protein
MNTGWENSRGRLLALHALEKTVRDMRRGDGFLYGNAGSGAMWVTVLDEERRETVGQEYEVLRDTQAPLIHGLIHIRNGVAHAALVTTQDGGLTAPLVAPLKVGSPSWRSIEQLHRYWTPQGLQKPTVQNRIAMYEAHLAGIEPAATLQVAIDFFRALERVDWVPEEFGSRD